MRAELAQSRFGSVACAFVLRADFYHAKVGAGARAYAVVYVNQKPSPTSN